MTLREAQQDLDALSTTVQEGPVVITRRRKPVLVAMACSHFDSLVESDDAILTEEGHYHFPKDRSMPWRQSLARRKGGEVIVNDGPALTQAVGPYPSLFHGIVGTFAECGAKLLLGAGGPSMQLDGALSSPNIVK